MKYIRKNLQNIFVMLACLYAAFALSPRAYGFEIWDASGISTLPEAVYDKKVDIVYMRDIVPPPFCELDKARIVALGEQYRESETVILDVEGKVSAEYPCLQNFMQSTPAQIEASNDAYIKIIRWFKQGAGPNVKVGYYGMPSKAFNAAAGQLLSECNFNWAKPVSVYVEKEKALAPVLKETDFYAPSVYWHGKYPDVFKQSLFNVMGAVNWIHEPKPTYFFIWHRVNDKGRYGKIDNYPYHQAATMRFMLEAIKDVGADGVILWASYMENRVPQPNGSVAIPENNFGTRQQAQWYTNSNGCTQYADSGWLRELNRIKNID